LEKLNEKLRKFVDKNGRNFFHRTAVQHNISVVEEQCRFYQKQYTDAILAYLRRSTDKCGLTALSYAAINRSEIKTDLHNRLNYILYLMKDNDKLLKPHVNLNTC